ncbi:MAG: hypothetical protein HOE11_04545 [Candidatus Diapherotrites archaeon]|nr:hypothetical protein [Candidatus Diapherotrites archaeon]MBT4596822.1 hypothetical protein [Candidatus Diapherotrites archaeon]
MPSRLNRVVTIPKTGKKVHLSELVREMSKSREALGLSLAEHRVAVEKQIDAFKTLEKVIKVYEETGSLNETSRRTGVSVSSVKEYTNGKRLPQLISRAKAKHYLKKRKPLKITKGSSPSLSYLLGVMFGDLSRTRTIQQGKITNINLRVKDRVFASEVQKHLSAVGLASKIKRGRRFMELDASMTSLNALFNALTNYGRLVPTLSQRKRFIESEFPRLEGVGVLGSKADRKMFLQALFDSSGQLIRNGKARTPLITISPPVAIKQFIFDTLVEQGFKPRIWGKRVVLRPNETELFLKKIGIKRDTPLKVA